MITSIATSARRKSSGRRAAVASLLFVVVLVGGCGGSHGTPSVANLGSGSSSTTTPVPAASSSQAAEYTNGLRYARCMRANGEPDFPDPRNPGGFPTAAIESLDPSSPQFSSANARCVRLLPNDGQPTPAELQQFIERGLKFARCMRTHGQPSFPDPGISGGQITINFNNLDPNSPQYEKAAQHCAAILNT